MKNIFTANKFSNMDNDWLKILRNGCVEVLGIRLGYRKEFIIEKLSKTYTLEKNNKHSLYISNISIGAIQECSVLFNCNNDSYLYSIQISCVLHDTASVDEFMHEITYRFDNNLYLFTKEIVDNKSSIQYANNLLNVKIYKQKITGGNPNDIIVILIISAPLLKEIENGNLLQEQSTRKIIDLYKNSVVIDKKTVKFVSLTIIVKTLIVLLFLCLGYLYVLNGRYSHIGSFYYFDKWTQKIINAGK